MTRSVQFLLTSSLKVYARSAIDRGSWARWPPEPGGESSVMGSRAPTDSGIAASAADVPSITDAPKGLAVVAVAETILHIAPGTRSEGVQPLRQNEQVKLLGQA